MQSAYLIPAEAIAEPEPPPGFPEDPQAARTRAQLTTARATGRAGRGVAQGTLNGLYRIADNSDVTPQALTARSTPAREWIHPFASPRPRVHARVGTPTRSRAADCRSPPGVRQGASTGPAGVRSKQPRCGRHRFRRDAAVRARPRPVAALSPIERRAGRRRSAAGGELSWSGIRGSGRRWAALALISVVIARQLSHDCTFHTRGPRSIAMSSPAANNQLTWRGSSQGRRQMAWLSANPMWHAFGTRALMHASYGGADFGERRATIDRLSEGSGSQHLQHASLAFGYRGGIFELLGVAGLRRIRVVGCAGLVVLALMVLGVSAGGSAGAARGRQRPARISASHGAFPSRPAGGAGSKARCGSCCAAVR